MRNTATALRWMTSRREIDLRSGPLIMAVINVTPDSFSDGGKYLDLDVAVARAAEALEKGADILDIGGESTRPGAKKVTADEELARVIPVINEISRRFDAPISVDTTKQLVAERALGAGAEIVNDVSGLKFDKRMASTVSKHAAGVVMMHLRGDFETVHSLPPPADIFDEVTRGFEERLEIASRAGIRRENVCLDVGIGFGKSLDQNLELIANLEGIKSRFQQFPILIGTSRKSFLGKLLEGASADERLAATLAANAVALWNGADIIRVHDVKAHAALIKVIKGLNLNRKVRAGHGLG